LHYLNDLPEKCKRSAASLPLSPRQCGVRRQWDPGFRPASATHSRSRWRSHGQLCRQGYCFSTRRLLLTENTPDTPLACTPAMFLSVRSQPRFQAEIAVLTMMWIGAPPGGRTGLGSHAVDRSVGCQPDAIIVRRQGSTSIWLSTLSTPSIFLTTASPRFSRSDGSPHRESDLVTFHLEREVVEQAVVRQHDQFLVDLPLQPLLWTGLVWAEAMLNVQLRGSLQELWFESSGCSPFHLVRFGCV